MTDTCHHAYMEREQEAVPAHGWKWLDEAYELLKRSAPHVPPDLRKKIERHLKPDVDLSAIFGDAHRPNPVHRQNRARRGSEGRK